MLHSRQTARNLSHNLFSQRSLEHPGQVGLLRHKQVSEAIKCFLMRMFVKMISRSPLHLLEEILLVDDASTMEHLQKE